ncbi:MAG: hypothetical protein JWQ43_915 [Glaciihabitans sp.]|nr:hypothetical protein [Glaciihabitans sp.]
MPNPMNTRRGWFAGRRRGSATAAATAVLVVLTVGACATTPPAGGEVAPVASVQVAAAWEALPDSPLSPRNGTAGQWVDGAFIVVGGYDTNPCPVGVTCDMDPGIPLRDGARFDPATGEWTSIADAPVPVSGGKSVVVAGLIYFLTVGTGGQANPAEFLRYDPLADVWSELALPPGYWPQLVAAGERVIAVQNTDENGESPDAVFSPTDNSWRPLPADPLGPSFDRQAVWLGDRLFFSARKLLASLGADEPSVARIATLSSDLTEWTQLADSGIVHDSPIAVGGRVVFPYGGEVMDGTPGISFGGVFNPENGLWTPLPDVGSPLAFGGSVFDAVGHVVVGDRLFNMELSQLFDPASGELSPVPPLPGAPGYGQTVLATDSIIFVWGGVEGATNLNTGHILRMADN